MTQHHQFSVSMAIERQQDLLRSAATSRIARIARRSRRTKPAGGARPAQEPSSVPIAESSPSPVAAPTTSPSFDVQTA